MIIAWLCISLRMINTGFVLNFYINNYQWSLVLLHNMLTVNAYYCGVEQKKYSSYNIISCKRRLPIKCFTRSNIIFNSFGHFKKCNFSDAQFWWNMQENSNFLANDLIIPHRSWKSFVNWSWSFWEKRYTKTSILSFLHSYISSICFLMDEHPDVYEPALAIINLLSIGASYKSMHIKITMCFSIRWFHNLF